MGNQWWERAEIASIPYHASADVISSGQLSLPDESAGNRILLNFTVPQDWSGSDITAKLVFEGQNGDGLVDLEYQVDYAAYDSNDVAFTTVTAMTNVPTQPTYGTGARIDTVNLTILAANIARGRPFRIQFRRNTGDANTGTLYLSGVDIRHTRRRAVFGDRTPLTQYR